MTNPFARMALIFIVSAAGMLPDESASARTLEQQQHCLALALYWEARGEGRSGMLAVGWTILNRVASPEFPGTPCGVVYQGGARPGCQFSFYCDGQSDRPRHRHSWHRSMIIAALLLTRPPQDPTGGALYFHSTSVSSRWHQQRTRTVRIGQHVFYR